MRIKVNPNRFLEIEIEGFFYSDMVFFCPYCNSQQNTEYRQDFFLWDCPECEQTAFKANDEYHKRNYAEELE